MFELFRSLNEKQNKIYKYDEDSADNYVYRLKNREGPSIGRYINCKKLNVNYTDKNELISHFVRHHARSKILTVYSIDHNL